MQTTRSSTPPNDTRPVGWMVPTKQFAAMATQQVVELAQQDPSFAFRESARLLKDRVMSDVPDDIAQRAMDAFYPAVRIGTLVLDIDKVRRTLKNPDATNVDRVIDISHVVTDTVGVAGLVVLAVPNAPAIGTSMAAVAVAGDMIAYGYNLLRYIQSRGQSIAAAPDESTLAALPDLADVQLPSDTTLLIPCAVMADGRLVAADSTAGGYHGSLDIAPEEAFTRGLPGTSAESDGQAPLRGREGETMRAVSALVADPTGGAGAAEAAGEGGWVYEIRNQPTWTLDAAASQTGDAYVARQAAASSSTLSLVPGAVPPESIARAGRVERLPSGRLAVREWVENPRFSATTPPPQP